MAKKATRRGSIAPKNREHSRREDGLTRLDITRLQVWVSLARSAADDLEAVVGELKKRREFVMAFALLNILNRMPRHIKVDDDIPF